VKLPCDEAQIRSNPTARPCTQAAAPWILAAAILGSSLAFIDSTVVNVALPALQSNLNATVIDVQWVVEGYALFLAALILVGGSLGDLWGRRRIFVIGVALFAVSSAWCGLAASVHELILARCAQGIGAALLVPGSLAIISASFDGQHRGRAIGTWSGATAITTALGPVLGGWLIEHASWRWVFFINLPLAVAVILISWLRVPESRSPDVIKLDLSGATLVTLGLGGLVYGLIEAPRLGWQNLQVIAALALGVGLLLAFLLVERRSKSPMIPLSLFRSAAFSGANLLTLFLYAAISTFFFVYPLNLIQVQHYSATAAGAAGLPTILSLFFLSRWSGGLVAKYGPRLPLIVGPILVAVGFLLFTVPSAGGSYWRTFFVPFLALGIGLAVSVAPLTTVVMNSVSVSRAGIASGVNNAVSRFAGLLAIAVLGIVMLNAFQSCLAKRLDQLNVTPEVRQQLLADSINLGATQVPPAANPSQIPAIQNAIDLSFIFAFRMVMRICIGLSAFGAIVAGCWIKSGDSDALANPPVQPLRRTLKPRGT